MIKKYLQCILSLKNIIFELLDNLAILWDLDSLDSIAQLNLADEGRSVSFSPDGQWFAVGHDGSEVFIWPTANPQQPPNAHKHCIDEKVYHRCVAG